MTPVRILSVSLLLSLMASLAASQALAQALSPGPSPGEEERVQLIVSRPEPPTAKHKGAESGMHERMRGAIRQHAERRGPSFGVDEGRGLVRA